MTKYRVYLETTASVVVTVEVDDNLDEHDAKEAAIEKAFEDSPRGVCAQCSGWGENWSLDFGDFEVAQESDGKQVAPELAVD